MHAMQCTDIRFCISDVSQSRWNTCRSLGRILAKLAEAKSPASDIRVCNACTASIYMYSRTHSMKFGLFSCKCLARPPTSRYYHFFDFFSVWQWRLLQVRIACVESLLASKDGDGLQHVAQPTCQVRLIQAHLCYIHPTARLHSYALSSSRSLRQTQIRRRCSIVVC